MQISTLLAAAAASALTLMVSQPDMLRSYKVPVLLPATEGFQASLSKTPLSQIMAGVSVAAPVNPLSQDFMVRIPFNDGRWDVTGYVGAMPVSFMVDTGAFYVTLTKKTAETLGGLRRIDSRTVTLANGDVVTGDRVEIASIQIGFIQLTNVIGLVLPAKDGASNLLGSTFLNRVHWEHDSRNGEIAIWE